MLPYEYEVHNACGTSRGALVSLLLSLSLSLSLSSSLTFLSRERERERAREGCSGGTARIHPFNTRGNTTVMVHGRAAINATAGPLYASPPSLCSRSPWRQHPYRPHQGHRGVPGGGLGSRERGDAVPPPPRLSSVSPSIIAVGRNF